MRVVDLGTQAGMYVHQARFFVSDERVGFVGGAGWALGCWDVGCGTEFLFACVNYCLYCLFHYYLFYYSCTQTKPDLKHIYLLCSSCCCLVHASYRF